MQQEVCFSCEAYKHANWYNIIEYSLEFVAHLQFVTQGRHPNLSACNNTSVCCELVSYFDATNLQVICAVDLPHMASFSHRVI
jgi:hypothetical protein